MTPSGDCFCPSGRGQGQLQTISMCRGQTGSTCEQVVGSGVVDYVGLVAADHPPHNVDAGNHARDGMRDL